MSEFPATHDLTPIEIMLLRFAAEGWSYERIARIRGRRRDTIKNEASRILWKLGVADMTQSVIKAWGLGLIR